MKTMSVTVVLVVMFHYLGNSKNLFSPLGKLAGRAIYFACVNFFFFYYEQSYLSIYWTDFNDLFIFLIRSSFYDSSRDVAMATNLVAKMGQNYLPPCTYRSVNPKRNGISRPQCVC